MVYLGMVTSHWSLVIGEGWKRGFNLVNGLTVKVFVRDKLGANKFALPKLLHFIYFKHNPLFPNDQ
jgi:hypothetical protein